MVKMNNFRVAGNETLNISINKPRSGCYICNISRSDLEA